MRRSASAQVGTRGRVAVSGGHIAHGCLGVHSTVGRLAAGLYGARAAGGEEAPG